MCGRIGEGDRVCVCVPEWEGEREDFSRALLEPFLTPTVPDGGSYLGSGCRDRIDIKPSR